MELLTVREAAALCHLGEATIRRHVRTGRLPSTREGGRIRVRADDVSSLAEERLRRRRQKTGIIRPDDPIFGLMGIFDDQGFDSADKHALLADSPCYR